MLGMQRDKSTHQLMVTWDERRLGVICDAANKYRAAYLRESCCCCVCRSLDDCERALCESLAVMGLERCVEING